MQGIDEYENVHRREEQQKGQDDLHDIVVVFQLIEDIPFVYDSGVFGLDLNFGELFVDQVEKEAKEENERRDGNQPEGLDFTRIFLKGIGDS